MIQTEELIYSDAQQSYQGMQFSSLANDRSWWRMRHFFEEVFATS